MEISGFKFLSDFDSGNLCKVEEVSVSGKEDHDAEFQIWTKPDCYQTEFQVGRNCSWFHFGIVGGAPGAMIKFNIMNIGRQKSLFSQGMRPVCLVTSESDQWKRITEDPTVTWCEDGCILSFLFKNPDRTDKETFLAFTYPYKYEDLQQTLDGIEESFCKFPLDFNDLKTFDKTEIYVNRETVIQSLEKRNLDLLTITDLNGIEDSIEETLPDLFPKESNKRPHTFANKEIIFISSRVHPGETCASYVMKGFIDFLLSKNNAQAMKLREKYVFKILPMLNPDGVARGHYRMDTRGVNLNRDYENPTKEHSPTIFAAKKLIDYYHSYNIKEFISKSRIFIYIDIHGHATEKGVFVYGNNSDDTNFKVETSLFPKLMAINDPCFSYEKCKTTSLTINDHINGTNLDGCGRAYAHRITGLAQTYTLECSFNGGENKLGDNEDYTPETYTQLGESMAVSILDLTESNPQSKMSETTMKNLAGVKTWVTKRLKAQEMKEASRKSALASLLNNLTTKVGWQTSENNKDTEVDGSGHKRGRRSSGTI